MKILILLPAFLISQFAGAQQTLQQIQYGAYLNTSHSLWEEAVSKAEETFGSDSFEKALALYGLLNNTMARQDEASFKKYRKKTVKLLEQIIDENPAWGEPKAVLASTYGLIMAYSPMKGMFYGTKSSSLLNEAMTLQPDSPLVQKLYAGSMLYTPEQFGGDIDKAITAYEKALELYDVREETEENWLLLDSMMHLSISLRKKEKIKEAICVLQDALQVEANYKWAASELAQLTKK